MTPAISVIVPGYNRPEPLKYTLRSVAAAASALPAGAVETILVDDGSAPPLAEQLAGFDAQLSFAILRQENQGSIIARLAGLRAARGEFVLFLDSDDLIHPDKLARHVAVLEEQHADVAYDDFAVATLLPGYGASYAPGRVLRTVYGPPAEFYLRVQPAPHGPIYRRSYLLTALTPPLVPPERRMDPSGDVWLYFNLLCASARIVKIAAPLTAVGPHPETRYSQHWERLSLAALLVAEGFQQNCPASPDTEHARRIVGEVAFDSWRRLPRDIRHNHARRWLTVWRRSPHGPHAALGGPLFRSLAACAGPVLAGRLLRLRNAPYARSRTISDAELGRLFDE